jgi:hypothetical protein
MNLRDGLKIAPANELRHAGLRTKWAVGQTEIDESDPPLFATVDKHLQMTNQKKFR